MTFTLLFYLWYNMFLSSNPTQHKVEYTVSTSLTFNEFEGDYVMYFDDNTSYFYNETLVKIPRTIKNDGGTSATYRANDKDGFPIYKNLSDRRIIYKYEVFSERSKCLIDDLLPKVTWKITKETKNIKGVNCTQAYGAHGGRDYEVWFAPSVAVGHGPFALSGLPGLIIEARSIDGKLTINCKSLHLNNTDDIKLAPLDQKFDIPVFSYDEFKEKKKVIIEKQIIKSKAEGWGYTPLNPSVDWQIRKGYF